MSDHDGDILGDRSCELVLTGDVGRGALPDVIAVMPAALATMTRAALHAVTGDPARGEVPIATQGLSYRNAMVQVRLVVPVSVDLGGKVAGVIESMTSSARLVESPEPDSVQALASFYPVPPMEHRAYMVALHPVLMDAAQGRRVAVAGVGFDDWQTPAHRAAAEWGLPVDVFQRMDRLWALQVLSRLAFVDMEVRPVDAGR